VYNPNILFDCGKPFVFGRQDTLQLIDYTRFTANMLRVHDWDKNTNDNYIQCAIDNLGNGGTIYIYFRNSSDNMAEVFTKDLTRVREGQTSNETPEFVYELGQLLITSGLKLSEKKKEKGYIKYKLIKGTVDEPETALLINVVRGILSNIKKAGARKQIKLLGKTRNIYYKRAKNGRLIEMVTYKGELVPLKALKVIA
jgi:hypothetical protein